MSWMDTSLIGLIWWQAVLLFIFAIYTIVRAYVYFDSGIRRTLIGGSSQSSVKLYHLLWGIIDIPAMILGKFYHVLKFLFDIEVFPLKRNDKR